MAGDLSLLLPDWRGYAADDTPAAGARAIAEILPKLQMVEIGAPSFTTLELADGVIGLASIAEGAARTLATIREHHPSRIFTVGGTCGVELGPISYLNDRYKGDLAIVWLDAHGDLNTPQSSPSARFHGMVLRTLMGAGPEPLVRLLPRRLAPEQIVLAGVRDLDRDEHTFISDAAISLLTPADLLVPDRVAGRIRAAGFTRVYVHFDLDVLDPGVFADVLVPAPGGISMDDAVETIRGLVSAFDIVGFSVVEFRSRSGGGATRVRQMLQRTGVQIGALGNTRYRRE
jgi:arginase